jgi:leader peptidase (prepilin peptidase)/N-methyltransferase
MIDILYIIFGLAIGSFLNVCIYRIPKKEDIVFTPSHCNKCGTKIKWYNLIPVISYIILKGKCTNCNEKISIQYPIIELSNGAAYLGMYYYYGISVELFIYSVLFSALLVITMIDYRHQIIPNSTVIFILILGIINLFINMDNYLSYIIGFFVASVPLLILAIISGGKMGGGDIKLMAVAGLLLGWEYILLALMIGSIVGSVIGITLIMLKRIKRQEMIPFGPFLSFGIMIALVYGEKIINWYLNI